MFTLKVYNRLGASVPNGWSVILILTTYRFVWWLWNTWSLIDKCLEQENKRDKGLLYRKCWFHIRHTKQPIWLLRNWGRQLVETIHKQKQNNNQLLLGGILLLDNSRLEWCAHLSNALDHLQNDGNVFLVCCWWIWSTSCLLSLSVTNPNISQCRWSYLIELFRGK